MEGSSNNYSNSSLSVSNQTQPAPIVMAANQGIKLENPFSLRVAQVFTGFGVGCGIGIGVGTPINMGRIPMVGEVMSAARGATDAFSGVSRHVNDTLRKVGAKNIQAGIGCGVGFGHGFGVGLALKPGVVQKIQACAVQLMTKMMIKFGMVPNLSIGQGAIPMTLQSSNEPSIQNPFGNIAQLTTKLEDNTLQRMPKSANFDQHSFYGNSASKVNSVDTSFGTRTEKVLNNFLQNPLLNADDTSSNDVTGRLQSENHMLQMVLKHQQVIEELMEENKKLRQILVEDLKVPPNKLQRDKSPCTECFECRRKQRKR